MPTVSVVDIVHTYVTHKKADVFPAEADMLQTLAREGDLVMAKSVSSKGLPARLAALVADMIALYARILRFHCFMGDLQWLSALARGERTCTLSEFIQGPRAQRSPQEDLQRFRQQQAAESERRMQAFQVRHNGEAFARMTLPAIARGYYKMHGGGTRFEAEFADVAKFSRASSALHVVRDGLVLGYAALCRAALRAQVEEECTLRCADVCRELGVPVPEAASDELNDATMPAVMRSYEAVVFRAARRHASDQRLRVRIEELRRECEEEEALIAAMETADAASGIATV